MKVCPSCGARFSASDWHCRICGNDPGHDCAVVVAPAAPSLRDADAELVERYAAAEEASFWSRVRNKLVVWALGQYFPDAASFFEVGCGAGIVLAAVHRAFPGLRLGGCDTDPLALALARHRLPDVELLQADARRLPFDEEFDVVGALDVLEHVDEDEHALVEIHRSLRPGGGLLVAVPQGRFLWSAADDYALHRRRYRRRELTHKVRAAGFDVVRTTSFVSTLLPLMMLSRLRQRDAAFYDPFAEFRLPRPLEAVLRAALELDRLAIRRGLDLPAGGSLLLVARKAGAT